MATSGKDTSLKLSDSNKEQAMYPPTPYNIERKSPKTFEYSYFIFQISLLR